MSVAAMAMKDADAFYQRLCSRIESRYMADVSEMRKECGRLEIRNQEIDDMFLSLYSDKTKGVLTEQRFMRLTAAMEQEQGENQRRLQESRQIMLVPGLCKLSYYVIIQPDVTETVCKNYIQT